MLGLCLFSAAVAAPPVAETPLVVPPGTPLRLYLTKRVPKKAGAAVEARVLDPVYVFDRQVIPAGAIVTGRVNRLRSVSKWQRTRAILGGDFTPLHLAPIEFTTLVMPDGRKIPLHTEEGLGLASIAIPRAASAQNTGVLGTGKQTVKDTIHQQIDRAKSIPSLVRGPDKKEKLEDYLMAKLPYHPQYVRKGTRFNAEVLEPVRFGSEAVKPGSLTLLGTQPPAGSLAHAWLVTPLDSASSKQGQIVEAVLAEPVYSAGHQLILPEGTRLKGMVVEARGARRFHRSGRLRFRFRDMDLPAEIARLQAVTAVAAPDPPAPPKKLEVRTEANLQSAESSSKTRLKVDSEGGVRATESKTRFLAAAAAVMIARRAADNDAIRNQSGQVTGQSQNVAGRTLGGGLGFGLLGSAIAQSSRYVGTAFGFYGMAWSVYSTVVARGSEVQFPKDSMVDIRFDARTENATAATNRKARH